MEGNSPNRYAMSPSNASMEKVPRTPQGGSSGKSSAWNTFVLNRGNAMAEAEIKRRSPSFAKVISAP